MNRILWPLSAMMLVQAMATMGVVTVPVLAPAIATALSVDASTVGHYQSIAYAGAALLTLMSGSLVHRYGGVRINQASALLGAFALALTASGQVPVIVVAAVVIGMAYGLATPGASHVLARVAPARHRGLVFSIKQSSVPMGGLFAGVLLPPVAEAYGWAAAVLLSSALVASAALIIAPLRESIDDDRNPRHRVSLGAPGQAVALVMANPTLRVVALVGFSFGAAQLCLFAFMVTYLVDRAGLDLVRAGLVYAVMQGAGVIARVVWGWVNDRLMPTRPMLALLGVGVVVSTAVLTTISPEWTLVELALVAGVLGVTAVGWNGIYLAEVARSVPLNEVGPATGGTLLFTFTGIVVGPSSFGFALIATGSYTVAFTGMGLLVLLTVIALLWPTGPARVR